MSSHSSPWLIPVVATLLLLGCASNHYETYTAKNPDWFSTFPDADAELHETLAGLYAPHEFRYRLSISKLAVVRLTDGAAQRSRRKRLHVSSMLRREGRATASSQRSTVAPRST